MKKVNAKKLNKEIRSKHGFFLKSYCERRNLSYTSLCKGLISKKAIQTLEKDGIELCGVQ